MRGYKEEGTTTTPFDMVMLNDLDRYHLVMDVIDRVPGPGHRGTPGCARQMVDERLDAREYTREHGEDIPEVRDWVWPGVGEAGPARPGGHADHRRRQRVGLDVVWAPAHGLQVRPRPPSRIRDQSTPVPRRSAVNLDSVESVAIEILGER